MFQKTLHANISTTLLKCTIKGPIQSGIVLDMSVQLICMRVQPAPMLQKMPQGTFSASSKPLLLVLGDRPANAHSIPLRGGKASLRAVSASLPGIAAFVGGVGWLPGWERAGGGVGPAATITTGSCPLCRATWLETEALASAPSK